MHQWRRIVQSKHIFSVTLECHSMVKSQLLNSCGLKVN